MSGNRGYDAAPDPVGNPLEPAPPGTAELRACPYCWQPPCDGEHNPMWECPECRPAGGFAPIHAECQRAIDLYDQEREHV